MRSNRRNIVIVSVTTANVPHVPASEAFSYDDLGYADDGIQHLSIRIGFSDDPNLPAALRTARIAGVLDQHLDESTVSYFVSRGAIRPTSAPGMPQWRKKLFVALARNATNPAARFGLPPQRTVTMGSDIDL